MRAFREMMVPPKTLVYGLALLCAFGVVGLKDVYSEQRQKHKAVKAFRAAAERTLPQDVPLIEFWDAHVHLNDVDMQFALMKERKVAGAIVFWGRNSTNNSILDAAREYPDKFIPFVSVSPERAKYRRLWNRDDPMLIRFLETQLKTGQFKGIGEISVAHFPGHGFPETNYDPVAPSMVGIMNLARKYQVPITIHCEVTRLNAFSELLRTYDSVNVIWAHGGYTPYYLAKRMLESHPNLYYELSARTWPAHPRSSDYSIFKSNDEVWNQWLKLIEEKPERFLVGSDASHHSFERDKSKIISVQLLLAQLSPQARKKVASENLLSLMQ